MFCGWGRRWGGKKGGRSARQRKSERDVFFFVFTSSACFSFSCERVDHTSAGGVSRALIAFAKHTHQPTMAASAVDAYRREVEVLKQLQEGASCVCVWCRAHVCCTTSCVCCVLGRAGQDGGPHSSPTAEATAHLPTLCIRPPFLHQPRPHDNLFSRPTQTQTCNATRPPSKLSCRNATKTTWCWPNWSAWPTATQCSN